MGKGKRKPTHILFLTQPLWQFWDVSSQSYSVSGSHWGSWETAKEWWLRGTDIFLFMGLQSGPPSPSQRDAVGRNELGHGFSWVFYPLTKPDQVSVVWTVSKYFMESRSRWGPGGTSKYTGFRGAAWKCEVKQRQRLLQGAGWKKHAQLICLFIYLFNRTILSPFCVPGIVNVLRLQCDHEGQTMALCNKQTDRGNINGSMVHTQWEHNKKISGGRGSSKERK